MSLCGERPRQSKQFVNGSLPGLAGLTLTWIRHLPAVTVAASAAPPRYWATT